MKITMSQPKTILNIVRVINEKLKVSSKEDKIISLFPWDFRNEDGDKIQKMNLKEGLRKLAKDQKLLRLVDIKCLDRVGWFSGERIKFEVRDREALLKMEKSAEKSIKKKIKHIALDPKSYSLIINHQDYVSFKSKRHKQDLEAETKQFKVLYHLWEFRKEMKTGK